MHVLWRHKPWKKIDAEASPPVVCDLTNHLCTVILGRVSMILKYACFVETQTMEEDFLSFNIIGIGYDIEIYMFCGDTNHGRGLFWDESV